MAKSRYMMMLFLLGLSLFFAILFLILYTLDLTHGIYADHALSVPLSEVSYRSPVSWTLLVLSFVLMIYPSRQISSTMKGIVGKTVVISSTRSEHDGISRYGGFKIRIQCSDAISPGDRVKVVDRTVIWAGRVRVAIYLGKRLSENDPDWSAADTP